MNSEFSAKKKIIFVQDSSGYTGSVKYYSITVHPYK